MKFYSQISDESKIKPSIFFLVTSHHPPCQLNRTWRICVGDHKLFICTRCFGQYIGISAGLLVIFLGFVVPNPQSAFVFFALLPLPVTLDWLMQTILRRESTNPRRAMTGFLFGVSIGLFIGTVFRPVSNVLAIAGLSYITYIITVFWLLQKADVLESYLAPYEQFLLSLE